MKLGQDLICGIWCLWPLVATKLYDIFPTYIDYLGLSNTNLDLIDAVEMKPPGYQIYIDLNSILLT